jgi:hypothetical protein
MNNFYSVVLAGVLGSLAMPVMAFSINDAATLQSTTPKALIPRIVENARMPERMPEFGDPAAIITKAPTGETKQYVRDGYYWYPYWGYMMFDYKSNTCAEMVEGDDGFTYIKNPYSNFVSDTYLKGKREDNKIKVTLPQPIYQEPNLTEPGKTNTYYAVIMVEEYVGSDYYMVTDQTELTYTVDGDKITLDLGYIPQQDPWGGWQYPYYILGLVTDEGIWMSEGEALQTWTPFEGKPVETPADLQFEDWAMTTSDGGQFVKLGFTEDSVYVKGILPAMPEGVFKGDIDGDKILISSGQYIGIYNSDTYTYVAGVEYDAENNPSYVDQLVFKYDRQTNTISLDDNHAIAYSRVPDALSVIKMWRNTMFRMQPVDIDHTPLAPSIVEYKAFSDEEGQGFFRINLPITNKDGYLLNDKNMYYNVYFDGALETFYTDEYTRLEYDMTDIPYTFGDGWNFYALGTVHVLYYYSRGVKTAGFTLCNKVDGVVYSSPMTILDLATGEVTTDVKSIRANAQVMAEEWYSLDGRRIKRPESGIFIHRTILNDGSVNVEKVRVK